MNRFINLKTLFVATTAFAVFLPFVLFSNAQAVFGTNDQINSGFVTYGTNDTIDTGSIFGTNDAIDSHSGIVIGTNDTIDPTYRPTATPTIIIGPNDTIDPTTTVLPDGCGFIYHRVVCGAPFSSPVIKTPRVFPTYTPVYTILPTYTFTPRPSYSPTPSRTTSPLPPIAIPTVDLKVRAGGTSTFSNGPITINYNVPIELSWSSQNVTGCTATGNWNGARGTAGALFIEAGLQPGQYAYVLNCNGTHGSATDSVTVNVREPIVAPTVNLFINGNDNAATVDFNQPATLTWSSSNATSCIASGDWSGNKSTNGLQTIFNNTVRKAFLLTCTGQGGSVTDLVNLAVNSSSPTPTTQPQLNVTLEAQPNNGTAPFTSVLVARVSGNTNGPITYRFDCLGDGFYEGVQSNLSSTVSSYVCSYNQSGGYNARVIAERDGLSASSTANVSVNNGQAYNPVTVNLTSNKTNVASGESAVLSWNSNNAQYCTASNGWSGNKSVSGSELVYNIYDTTTYTLICYGNNGSASSAVTIFANGTTTNNNNANISKLVRNISRASGLGDSINAQPNDTLEFVITVTAQGNTSSNDIRVRDYLPYGLRYINGSATRDGSSINDEIVNSSYLIGTMYAGQTTTFRLQATVQDNFITNYINSTITNTANITTSNYSTVSDSATVYVNRSNTVIDNNQNGQLSIQKFGKNVTQGQATEQSSLTAKPNDTLEFVLHVRSQSSGTIENVIVRDLLPDGLIYVPRSTSINGIQANDGIAGTSGLAIGSIGAYQEIIVRFSTTVNPQFFQRATTALTNTATATGNNTQSSVQAGLPINVKNSAFGGTGTIGSVATGTSGSVAIALTAGMLATLGFVFYSRTNSYKYSQLVRAASNARAKNKFNFA